MVRILLRKLQSKEDKWVECRCPVCNTLLFERSERFKKNSVRMKCRKCKSMLTL